MVRLNEKWEIPDNELEWQYVRSSGPGGQNVNKVASKVQLRWRVVDNRSLPPEVRDRLKQRERNRITIEGDLVLSSQKTRDQERNREDCLAKLAEMIESAAYRPKTRRATKPTRGSQERRLKAKKQRSERKSGRRFGADD